ncbi:squalene--hopene cyclase [Streptomyces ochraceiscleroticus]|uniref:squalene--hopene cyclase n=1 Tax=Streptomyces ochraceiscleroticus TaxID=47761 RepID=UPI0004C7A373|nr:squalene--hopene cyclase [Streptomyces ochraceiscleroticus]
MTTTADDSSRAEAAAEQTEEAARRAVRRATDHLLERQHAEGYWRGVMGSDPMFDAQDLLMRQFLGIMDERVTAATGRWLRSQQRADGSWAAVHGNPGSITATVQAYVALRLAGDGPDEPHMLRSAAWAREHGGVAASKLPARVWLALFGWWSWDDLPEMPPEMIALPRWAPLNIYSFNSFMRLALVPLLVIGAHRPVKPAPFRIDELFTGRGAPPRPARKAPIGSWEGFFQRLDTVLRVHRRVGSRWVRRTAVNACVQWLVARQEADGGWGGIRTFSTLGVIALYLHGFALDHPVLKSALGALDSYADWPEDGVRRTELCQSPVWDTCLSTIALVDAGLPADHPALVGAADWMLARQTTRRGDWAVRRPRLEPGGWAFEFHNETSPDTDDTAEVALALHRVAHPDPARVEAAVGRALRWNLGMQSENGAWGAFDADNTSSLPDKVPFFDVGYCTDPPTADVTAHVVEMLAALGLKDDPRTRRGVRWLLDEQEDNGAWFGRWGVNYLYGTGCVVPALITAGVPLGHPAVRRAVAWLESVQNADGGWGEEWRSYSDPSYAGRGPSTASQTAWALLALLSAGEREGAAVEAGVRRLIRTQSASGSWDEPYCTGTAIPDFNALHYGLYGHVFPLTALGRYVRRQNNGAGSR